MSFAVLASVNKGAQTQAEQVAEEILDYLREHPEAADTLDGVLQWWLIRRRYLRGLDQVQRALDLLEENGLIDQQTNPDRSVVYSAAKSKPKN